MMDGADGGIGALFESFEAFDDGFEVRAEGAFELEVISGVKSGSGNREDCGGGGSQRHCSPCVRPVYSRFRRAASVGG